MTALNGVDTKRFMTELLAIWTETDVVVRHAAVEAHYADDVVFHDPDGDFSGYAELESFSDSLQQRFPGQHFEMIGEPTAVGDALRTYWRFGAVSGMDFAILYEGKITTLYAFVERPAG
jgi:hypothetical protein